jgi:acyl-CoA reductase-like NAD-dependent aldehyde dehydrogenase
MFIDGSCQPAEAGDGIAVHDRWTGELIGTVACAGAAEVDAAVSALAGWRGAPNPAERAAILTRAAETLEARVAKFAQLITAESGVCRAETVREVGRAVANLRVAAVEAERVRGESIPLPNAPRLAVTVPEPIGVVLGITPFNRPLNQVVVKVAPALAAGCPIVLKPSEKTPLTALLFAQLLIDAGCPKDMLAVLTGDPAVLGPMLAGHSGVDMVTFTGSVATGRAVAAAAAGKKLLLELGGNDPLFVLPDADLAAAARLAADGACATAGQSCRGIKRVFVWDEVADVFVPMLAKAVAAKRFGDPREPQTQVGPLISEQAAIAVESRITAAVDAGARLLTGGRRSGSLVEPTVLDRVSPEAELVREETLGPVAPVLRVSSVEEAAALSNGTPYGLQAGVLTNDSARFWDLAARLRVGAVNLGEGPHFDSPHIPFGGVKASGVGREGIRYAIAEMTSIKTITVPYPAGDR